VADILSRAFRMRAIDINRPVHSALEAEYAEGLPAREVAINPVETRWGWLLTRLSASELRRRAWHMLPGLTPFVLWDLPHRDPFSPIMQLIIVGLCLGVGGAAYAKYHCISRDGDEECVRLSCVLGYAGSMVAATLLFPSAGEIAFALLAILAFGDGSATLVGKLLRGPSLPWNRRKTWSGFLAFILAALPTAALLYWGESNNPEAVQPGVTLDVAFLCVSFAVVGSAIAETVSMRLNDNIRVGVVSLACLALAHSAIVGW
jgi:phytol kinase